MTSRKRQGGDTLAIAMGDSAMRAQARLIEALEQNECEVDAGSRRAVRRVVTRSFFARFASEMHLSTPGFDPRIPPLPSADLDPFLREVASVPCPERHAEMLSAVLECLAERKDKRARGATFTPRWFAAPIVAKTLEPLLLVVPPERSLELRVCDPAVGAGIFLLELVSQLGDRILAAGGAADVYAARRLVAIHCAYGVDIDVVSVETAKLALWLECRAERMPWSWLDDNIKHGDALVGLSNEQISAFHWKHAPPDPAIVALVKTAMVEGVHMRRTRMNDLAEIARCA